MRKWSRESTNHRFRHSFHTLEWLMVSRGPSIRIRLVNDRCRARFEPLIVIMSYDISSFCRPTSNKQVRPTS